jgi:hypothetical protein
LRQQPDFFEDLPLVLLYIAKKLKESLALEKLLDEADLDYHIEVDHYVGGLLFRSERAGAFFYVAEPDVPRAADLLKANRYRPHEEGPD